MEMVANRKPKATAVKVTPGVSTLWFVKWPDVPMKKEGKSYYATTYPDSDLVYLETAAKRRHVAQLTAAKILPEIREAIARATNKPA